jgi:hypothetical protein
MYYEYCLLVDGRVATSADFAYKMQSWSIRWFRTWYKQMVSFSNNRCYFLHDAQRICTTIKNLPIKLDSVRLPICYGYATVGSLELRRQCKTQLVNWCGRGTRCCGKLKPIILFDERSSRRKDSWIRHSSCALCYWQRETVPEPSINIRERRVRSSLPQSQSSILLLCSAPSLPVRKQKLATLLCSKLATVGQRQITTLLCSKLASQPAANCYSALLQACHLLLPVPTLAYYSTLKMEVICSCETSRSLQTTRRYNQEDRTLHRHAVRSSNPIIYKEIQY